jgi:hypothetical protein
VHKAKHTDKIIQDLTSFEKQIKSAVIEDEILPTQESVCMSRSPTKMQSKLTQMNERVTQKPMTSFSEMMAHPKSVEDELKELVDSQRQTIKVLTKKLECAESMVQSKDRVI